MDLEYAIKEYDSLIHSIANKYKDSSNVVYEYKDLYQEAVTGFIEAYNKFDPNRGTKLSTYAVHVMNMKLANYVLTLNNSIKFPYVYTKVWNAIREYDTKDIKILSKITELPNKKVAEAIQWYEVRNANSLDEYVTDDTGNSYHKYEQYASNLDDYTNMYINEFVSKLDDRTKQVIELKLKDLTQTNISIKLNISQGLVSLILKNVGNNLNIYIEER